MTPAVAMLILHIIDLVAASLQWVAEEKAQYESLRNDIMGFIETGTEPSDEQMLAILARSKSLTERIRAALEAKRRAEGGA